MAFSLVQSRRCRRLWQRVSVEIFVKVLFGSIFFFNSVMTMTTVATISPAHGGADADTFEQSWES